MKVAEKELTFRKLVADYSDQLYQYARKRLPDEELCKDLVQETFLAAWRNIDGYRRDASEKTWLFVILKNKITDHYRSVHTRWLQQSANTGDEEGIFFDEEEHWRQGAYPAAWSVELDNRVEAKEFQLVFRQCSSRLKEMQHAVFAMKYVEDLSSEEICRLLNLTNANYWVLLHRAKVQLRACLEKNWLKR